jgi:hypothetical protein
MEFYGREASDGSRFQPGRRRRSVTDLEGELFVAKIREALAALTEAEAILSARGLGRYRPIGVAEKRAQLEAAGEEWPIGDDGLPKVWSASATHRGGGFWARRSSIREYQSRRRNRTRDTA